MKTASPPVDRPRLLLIVEPTLSRCGWECLKWVLERGSMRWSVHWTAERFYLPPRTLERCAPYAIFCAGALHWWPSERRQITLSELEERSDLDFGRMKDFDVLAAQPVPKSVLMGAQLRLPLEYVREIVLWAP